MHAMPFRLLGGSTLRAVETALTRAAGAWAGEWGFPAASLSLSAERAWEVGPRRNAAPFTQRAQANGRGLWIACGSDLATELQKHLFPGDGSQAAVSTAPAVLAAAGAREAGEALLDTLSRAALTSHQDVSRSPDAEAPAAAWRRGSGAILATLTLGRHRCHLLLDSEAVQALQLPAASLAPLEAVDYRAAVAAAPVALHLKIGAARVGLGNLLSLAPGDVIRLGTAVDAPVTLDTAAGNVLFSAYLGRSGDSVAVELVNNPSPSFGAVQ